MHLVEAHPVVLAPGDDDSVEPRLRQQADPSGRAARATGVVQRQPGLGDRGSDLDDEGGERVVVADLGVPVLGQPVELLAQVRQPGPVLGRRPAVQAAVGAAHAVDGADVPVLAGGGGPAGLGTVGERAGDDPARTVGLVDDEPPAAADRTADDDFTAGQNTHDASPFPHPCGSPPGKYGDRNRVRSMLAVCQKGTGGTPFPRLRRRVRGARSRIVALATDTARDPHRPCPHVDRICARGAWTLAWIGR